MPKPHKLPVTPRATVVARISKEKIARGWSLDAQVAECRIWAEKHLGVTIADSDIQTEDGVSGRKISLDQRPGLNAAVQGARNGIYTHIIFHAVDRGARNLGIMCQVLDEMNALGVVVVSAVDNQCSDSASGKSFFQMVTMMAQWQAERTSEQIEAMQRARRKAGLPNGPLPFGVVTMDGKPAPDMRPLALHGGPTTNHQGLLLAFTLRAENQSGREIARALNEAGYRTTGRHAGNLWGPSSVEYLLRNRFYIAEIPSKPLDKNSITTYMHGEFPPIVSREVWHAAQAITAQRHVVRQSAPKASRVYSLGGGMVRCLACEAKGTPATFQVYAQRRQESWHGSLACGNRLMKATCTQPSAPLRLLEQQVEWCLHDLVMPDEDMRALAEGYVEHQAAQTTKDATQATISRLEARMVRQKRLYELGDWDEATYLSERAPILAELERLHRVVVPMAVQTLYDLSDYVRDMALAWRAADHAQKRTMAELLFVALYVHDRRIVAVRPTAAFWPLFAALASRGDQWQNANNAGLDETLKDALPGDAIILGNSGAVGARRATYLPPSQWQHLYAAYQTGMSYAALAAQFGISLSAVQYGIHDEKVRRGVPTRRADRIDPRKRGGQ